MNLQEFRSQYPEYDGVADDELTRRLYAKYYPTKMSFNDFHSKFVGAPPAEQEQAPVESAPSRASDIGHDVLSQTEQMGSGVLEIPKLIASLGEDTEAPTSEQAGNTLWAGVKKVYHGLTTPTGVPMGTPESHQKQNQLTGEILGGAGEAVKGVTGGVRRYVQDTFQTGDPVTDKLMWLNRKVYGAIGNSKPVVASQEWLNKKSDEATAAMSPEYQASIAKSAVDQDSEGTYTPGTGLEDPMWWVHGGINMGVQMPLMLAPPAISARVGYGMVLRDVLASDAVKNMPQSIAVDYASKQAEKAGVRAAMLTGGLTEGVFSGAQDAQQTEQTINQIDEETLLHYEPYRKLREQGMTHEQARAIVARSKALAVGISAATVVGLTGAPLNAWIGKWATVGLHAGRIKTALQGAGMEAAQETIQGGAEQLIQNKAEQPIDQKDTWDQVLNQAVSGGLIAGLFGGAEGALAGHGGHMSEDQQKKADAVKAAQQAYSDAEQKLHTAESQARDPNVRLKYDDLVTARQEHQQATVGLAQAMLDSGHLDKNTQKTVAQALHDARAAGVEMPEETNQPGTAAEPAALSTEEQGHYDALTAISKAEPVTAEQLHPLVASGLVKVSTEGQPVLLPAGRRQRKALDARVVAAEQQSGEKATDLQEGVQPPQTSENTTPPPGGQGQLKEPLTAKKRKTPKAEITAAKGIEIMTDKVPTQDQLDQAEANIKVAEIAGTDTGNMRAAFEKAKTLKVEADASKSAGLNPKTITTALQLHRETGGFTVNPKTGKPQKSGWAFAPSKTSEKVFDHEPTPAEVGEYAKSQKATLSKPGHFLGGWKDGARHVLDVSQVNADRGVAEDRARAANQDAIFNLGTMETIYAKDFKRPVREVKVAASARASVKPTNDVRATSYDVKTAKRFGMTEEQIRAEAKAEKKQKPVTADKRKEMARAALLDFLKLKPAGKTLRFRHFSPTKVAELELNPNRQGTGMKGEEQARGGEKVISFYGEHGKVEHELRGHHEYHVDIPEHELYNANEDPLKLREKSKVPVSFNLDENGKMIPSESQFDFNRYEANIKKAGYRGYHMPEATGILRGQARLFKKTTVTNSKMEAERLTSRASVKKPAKPTRIMQVDEALKQVAGLLTPREKSTLHKATAKRLADIFAELPSDKEMAAAAIAGQAKRGWYERSSKAIVNVFGPDAPRFAGLLAALSPKTSVEQNFKNAVAVFVAWDKAGRPQTRAEITQIMRDSVFPGSNRLGLYGVLPAWIPNSVRALTSENPDTVTLSGPKVDSFAANLRGETNRVTLDAWMANFANVDQKLFAGSLTKSGPGTGPGYLAFTARVRQAAERLTKMTGKPWTPAEVQETIWSWAKTLYEHADSYKGLATAKEILDSKELTDELINATPDFVTQFADPVAERILREAGYGDQLDQLTGQENAAGTGAEKTGALEGDSARLRRAAGRLDAIREQRAAQAEANRAEAMASVSNRNPPFFSRAVQAVDGLTMNSAPGAQWLATIKNQPSVKQEELDYMGLPEWLQDQPKVSKEDLLAFMRANELHITETAFGNAVDANGVTTTGIPKYAKYTTPEGFNYRELLLTLPPSQGNREWATAQAAYEAADQHLVAARSLYNDLRIQRASANTDDHVKIDEINQATREAELKLRAADQEVFALRQRVRDVEGDTHFKSSHFDVNNVLAHVRFNEREDTDGNRVLFIEEVQSDWHQQGRKQGYQTPEQTESAHKKRLVAKQVAMEKAFRDAMSSEAIRAAGGMYGLIDYLHEHGLVTFARRNLGYDEPNPSSAAQKARDLALAYVEERQGYYHVLNGGRTPVPDAPFKTSWPELTMKRMIRYAAENGFSRIGWTTGEMQADRYALSKHINKIEWAETDNGRGNLTAYSGDNSSVIVQNDIPHDEVENFIGKVPAQKLFESKAVSTSELMQREYDARAHADKLLRNYFRERVDKVEGVYTEEQRASTLETITSGTLDSYLRTPKGKLKSFFDEGHDVPDDVISALKALRKAYDAYAPHAQHSYQTNIHTLSGLDLNIGGEGMKGFYDSVLPSTMSKYLKKWGVKVGEASINVGRKAPVTVHSIDLTDKMQESAFVGQPLFAQGQSRVGPNELAQSLKEAQAVADEINKTLGANVHVVARQSDLPPEAAQFQDAILEGLYVPDEDAPLGGRVYIVGENLTSREGAAEVALHEAVGHMGLRALLGKDMDATMEALYKAFPHEAIAAAKRNNIDLKHPNKYVRLEGYRTAAEEMVAYAAGGLLSKKGVGAQQTTWEKIVAFVRNALRKVGFLKSWTEADLTNLIYRSRDYVRDFGKKNIRERNIYAGKYKSAASIKSRPLGSAPGNKHLDSFLNKIGSDKESLGDKWKRFKSTIGDRIAMSVFDQFHGIVRAANLAGVSLGDAGYFNARLSGNSAELVQSMMEYGHPVWNGDAPDVAGGIGFLDILKPLGDKVNPWLAYMVARRAQRLAGEGRENLFTPEEIKAALDLGKQNPEFDVVAEKYAAFQKKVLDFAQEAGIINPDSRALWENQDYIPFHRLVENGEVQQRASAGALGRIKNQIVQLKGGRANLGDPMDNITRNWLALMDASIKAHAAREVVDGLNGTGLVNQVPIVNQVVPAHNIKSFVKANPTLVASLKAVGVDVNKLNPQQLRGLQTQLAVPPPAEEGTISVWRNGHREHWAVHDEMLFQSLQGLKKSTWSPLMELLRAPKRWLTATVTITPQFLLKNVWRDMWHTFIVGTHDGKTIVPIKDTIIGTIDSMKMDATAQSMLAGGGSFAHGWIYGGDTAAGAAAIRRTLRAHHKGTGIILDTPLKAFRFYRKLQNASENANRVAIYRKSLKSGKARSEALYEARDIMDFSMQGASPVIQFLVQSVPFFNARLQGLYRIGRGITKKTALSIFMRGALLTAMSLAILARNWRDDRYKALSNDQKSNYWHLWDVFQKGDHWQIPKPFETGAVFGTVPEIIGDAMLTNADEPDRAQQAADLMLYTVGQQLNMSPQPAAIWPIVELATNKNSYTGAPILTEGDQGVLPEDQVGPNTSPTYREIAQHMPDFMPEALRSPKQLEFLARSYTGNVQDYALLASDFIARKLNNEAVTPKATSNDWPGLRDFRKVGPATHTKYADVMYDIADKATKVYQSRQKALGADTDEGDQRAQQIEDDNQQLLDVRTDFQKAAKTVGDLKKQQRQIQLDGNMTPDEKREQIDELQSEINDTARDIYDLRPGGKLNPKDGALLLNAAPKAQSKILRSSGLPATADLVDQSQSLQ